MTPARERAIRTLLGGGSWKCRTCQSLVEALDGPAIRRLRTARAVSQPKLAAAARISQGQLSDIENRNRPLSLKNAERLLDALGVRLPK